MAGRQKRLIFFTPILISQMNKKREIKIGFLAGKLDYRGMTLIEIMIAIFIFSIIMAAMVALFVSSSGSYQKSKAVKNVITEAQYAMNSISKDVRMGKIMQGQASTPVPAADGAREQYVMIIRNTDNQKVCYYIDYSGSEGFIGVQERLTTDTDCSIVAAGYRKIVDLKGTGLKFNSKSGFWSKPTDLAGANKNHGWVFIFFYFEPTSGIGLTNDDARIETYVAARDYGWAE
jgi:prepilin-type N-terminal cleavage/methylation domain-containing protein